MNNKLQAKVYEPAGQRTQKVIKKLKLIKNIKSKI